MANSIVYGMSGWWSGFFPPLRKPIELTLAAVKAKDRSIMCLDGTWHSWRKFADHLRDHEHVYRNVIVIGHSYGASAATKMADDLYHDHIPIDLFLSLDQGLDSFIVTDKPIRSNVRIVDEWHVAYERLTLAADFTGEYNFYEHTFGPGSWMRHTSYFTQPDVVETLRDRIIEIASR